MGRAKKTAQPPQSAEDVELAKQTITAAFGDAVERQRAELVKAQEEVLRLQRSVARAQARCDAWADHSEIDEDRAVQVWQFANEDMHMLARRFPHAPPARTEIDAARRKREVVQRYLADRNLLPAALVDPNWRPNQ